MKNSQISAKRQAVYDLLVDANINLLEVYKGFKEMHSCECMKCNVSFNTTPHNVKECYKKFGTNGCKSCLATRNSNKQQSIVDKMILLISEKGYNIVSDVVVTDSAYHHNTKVTVVRKVCGHRFTSPMYNLATGITICVICANENKTNIWNYSRGIKSIDVKRSDLIKHHYMSKVLKSTESSYKKFRNIINKDNIERTTVSTSINFEKTFKLDYLVTPEVGFNNNIPPHIIAHYTNLCMKQWKDVAPSAEQQLINAPQVIRNFITDSSSYMDELIHIIENYGIDYTIEIFDLISSVVLIDGTQYGIIIHKEESVFDKNVCKNYLRNIMEHYSDRGIKIKQCFLSEWMIAKKPIIYNLLYSTKLLTPTKIHARKCEVSLVSPEDKRSFLKENHIQGDERCSLTYGLYSNNTLLSVMSFTKKTDNGWILTRYASLNDFNVMGSSSKLLSHFKKNHNWSIIYSYANLMYSDGGLYEKLGFVKKTTNPPNFKFFIGGVLHHWRDFIHFKSKMVYFDHTKTDKENRILHKIHDVWNCGTITYVLTNIKDDTNAS